MTFNISFDYLCHKCYNSIMNSGIYQIKNLENGNIYIGSAVNLQNRFSVHVSLLKRNMHINRYLQNAWNKYGEDSFQFSIIECCEKEQLLIKEQYYLDQLKPRYNISPTTGNTLGVKYTLEQCLNISNSLKGKMIGEKNPSAKLTWEEVRKIRDIYKIGEHTFVTLANMFNCSDGTIQHIITNRNWIDENYIYKIDKIAHSNKAKLTWEKVKEIRDIYCNSNEYSQKDLAILFNVDHSTIKRIITNKTWCDKDYYYDINIGIKRKGFATTWKSEGK